ncbi:glycosyl hydrolase 53 family protein [Hymenobacter sp. NST-14]|uniref:glycosyl hydrolase 53 family protein n=1 Tax=Hymenobacter piscis TaxID=2839984 RepID=UPI001C022B05|nr:glycosyl hydrolase 53 family protein [Hymenobacter piscis]MBT9395511.1 glycosyl hydrolase 53 family protein [Hymenobacter piscis]
MNILSLLPIRRLLLLLSVLAGPLLLAAPAARAQTFAKGADVGWLQQMEAHNYYFYDEQGLRQDCFALLKARGINAIRLRVWVNPSMVDWVNGHCSPAEVVTMATRAQRLGFRVMIDFHYSDSWADPGQQTKPAAWAGHSFAQLLTDVYGHTFDVLTALRANGVTPEWVQVGNEIPNGLLWPEGHASNFGQLTQLLNQGYDAVKAVSPTSQVVIHLDQGNDNARFRWFFDQLTAAGGRYDVIGLSYYPYWLNQDYAASIGYLRFNLRDLASRYNKPVVVSEVGADCTGNPQNAYDMLVAVQNAVAAVPNGRGQGVFYWEPEGYRRFSGYQLSAFGNDGKPSAALNAFLVTPATPAPNLAENPGFEQGGAPTQTPAGWTSGASSAASYAADFTEADGHGGTFRLTHWLAAPYQVSTSQLRTGLVNGLYTLRAWVRNGGGQTSCRLYAKNFGGPEKSLDLPVTNAWTLVELSGVPVSNGQCEIGLWSDARAGNWCSLDDVELVASGAPALATAGGPALDLAPAIFPNPATDQLTCRRPAGAGGALRVTVRTLLGQTVLSQPFAPAAPELRLDVAGLAPGLYQVEISGAARASYKLLKN